MDVTRRTLVTGLASAVAAPACAQAPAFPPQPIRRSAGYLGWAAPSGPPRLPLEAPVVFENGRSAPLGQWLEGRPALLILWALWCTPCLAEKKPEDDLLLQLRAANSRTNVLALQIYDAPPIGEARAMLEKLGALSLPLARATPEAETKLAYLTGARERATISLPAMALVASDGREIGRYNGKMARLPGWPTWFQTPQALELLMRIGKEL
jgi:hypothetical protein